jgi:hypothetical protein
MHQVLAYADGIGWMPQGAERLATSTLRLFGAEAPPAGRLDRWGEIMSRVAPHAVLWIAGAWLAHELPHWERWSPEPDESRRTWFPHSMFWDGLCRDRSHCIVKPDAPDSLVYHEAFHAVFPRITAAEADALAEWTFNIPRPVDVRAGWWADPEEQVAWGFDRWATEQPLPVEPPAAVLAIFHGIRGGIIGRRRVND